MINEWHLHRDMVREAVAREIARRAAEAAQSTDDKRDERFAVEAERRLRRSRRAEKSMKRLVLKRLAIAITKDDEGARGRRRPTNRRMPRTTAITEPAVKPWMINALARLTRQRKPAGPGAAATGRMRRGG